MNEKVEVDPASLNTFAKVVKALAAEHAEAAGTHPEDLSAYSGAMYDEGPDFPEAHMFASAHSQLANSIQQMLTDAVSGLESLGNGAEYCAATYANSDQNNAAAQRKLDNALGPVQANDYVPPGNSKEEILIRKDAIYNKEHPVAATSNSGYGDDGFELTTSSGRKIEVAAEPGASAGN